MNGSPSMETTSALLDKAQRLARRGRDEEAKEAFLAILRSDPTHFGALTDLAGLALATGYRSAAVTAYRQAVAAHPNNPFGLVNLANVLLEDGDLAEARRLYEAALEIDPSLAFAHQGLANALGQLGDQDGAARHAAQGFAGHSTVERPYRGTGTPLRVLLIVSAKGGNVPTNLLLDDRLFSVTALYAEYHDPLSPLPAHDIVFNAVGDADLCERALDDAAKIVAQSKAPIINIPERVRATGRDAISASLSELPDLVVPHVRKMPRLAFEADAALRQPELDGFRFPLLLRSPGYHTGQHFVRVETAGALRAAAQQLPGEMLFVIQYHDARGPDGLARKYRVMFIDGKIYPLHLALSKSWKVHYFTSSMAEDVAYRREEEAFLTDTARVLGARATQGLAQVREALDFDYGGVDFGLAPDGRLLLFEANATMAIVPPTPDAIWDYRREPIARALDAARAMLFARANRDA